MKLEAAMAAAKEINIDAWAVGGILRELCRMSDRVRGLVEQDLDNPEMSLAKCFAAIKEYARKHQKGGSWSCPVFEITQENEVIKIITEFYKIPWEWLGGAAGTAEPQAFGHDAEEQESFDLLDLL